MTPTRKVRYEPTEQPGPARLNMTVDELHAMLQRFKSLFEDSTLATYIKMAGITGLILVLIEAGRVIVELYRHYNK
jgi:hypothetical protein